MLHNLFHEPSGQWTCGPVGLSSPTGWAFSHETTNPTWARAHPRGYKPRPLVAVSPGQLESPARQDPSYIGQQARLGLKPPPRVETLRVPQGWRPWLPPPPILPLYIGRRRLSSMLGQDRPKKLGLPVFYLEKAVFLKGGIFLKSFQKIVIFQNSFE